MIFSRVSPLFGAEVSGVDLRYPIDPAIISELKDGIRKYKVLVFRDQFITEDQQIIVSRHLGPLTIADPVTEGIEGYPAIKQNVMERTRTKFVSLYDYEDLMPQLSPIFSKGWHQDLSFLVNPNEYSILRVVTLPGCGGDTVWCDLEAVYDCLSSSLKAYVDCLEAIHVRDDTALGIKLNSDAKAEGIGSFASIHPLVRIHPETNKKSLFLSPGWIQKIVRLQDDESQNLLQFLINRMIQSHGHQIRLRWSKGSIAIWDNRNTAHCGPVDAIHFDERRVVHRTTVGAAIASGPNSLESRSVIGNPSRLIGGET